MLVVVEVLYQARATDGSVLSRPWLSALLNKAYTWIGLAVCLYLVTARVAPARPAADARR